MQDFAQDTFAAESKRMIDSSSMGGQEFEELPYGFYGLLDGREWPWRADYAITKILLIQPTIA